jgi:hypothetical protein
MISKLELQQDTIATYQLKSQGQVSAGENAARHYSHSLPGEPRTGMISKLKLQQGIHSPTGEPRIGTIRRL